MYRDGWVLPARHPRHLLFRAQLHLQHPRRPFAEGDRSLSGQRGRRYAARRRQARRGGQRPVHRPRPLRPDGSRRRSCRSFPATTRPTSTAAAAACWTSARSFGRDGWPVAGDNFTAGTYVIQSERSGYTLELAVDTVPMPHVRHRWPGFPGGPGPGAPGAPAAGTPPMPPPPPPEPETPPAPVPLQDVAVVSKDWPTGNLEVRLGDYILRPHQKWTITPVADAGGYLGSPYFKITIAGTDRALAATAEAELVTVPAFTRRARAALADRSARRRHVSDHAEAGAERERRVRADHGGRQHGHARQVRSPGRQGAVHVPRAVTRFPCAQRNVTRSAASAAHRAATSRRRGTTTARARVRWWRRVRRRRR